MTTPRITIGIPFFDEEKHLAEAIRSVLAQTFEDFELLLLDDGSTDRSLAIARAFDDPRISVASDGRRRRLPARLNEIVSRARGAYVARMDADDVIHPERLAREVAVLDADPSCDAVGTWAGLIDEEDRVLGVSESAPLPASPVVALERGLLPHATVLARREWLLAHPYDERLSRAEDRDLWCRVASTARLRVVPECLYVVRVSPDERRFVEDYAEAQRQNRMIFAKYGPRIVGWPRTARLVVASFGKSLVTRAMLRAGYVDALLRRRGRPARPEEERRIAEALRASRTSDQRP